MRTTRSNTPCTLQAKHTTAPHALHAPPSSRRTVERRVALTLLATVGSFQLALVAGAPWGAAAWAGQSPSVLPTSLRVASAVSVLVYGGLAVIVVTETDPDRTATGADRGEHPHGDRRCGEPGNPVAGGEALGARRSHARSAAVARPRGTLTHGPAPPKGLLRGSVTVSQRRQGTRRCGETATPPTCRSTFDSDENILGALRAGARGLLLKDAGPELLAQAVRAAADGDALLAPRLTARLLATLADRSAPSRWTRPAEALTPREDEVAAAVARGLTNAEIAAELHLSLSTVKFHLASIMTRTGARSRVEVVIWAYETGRAGR